MIFTPLPGTEGLCYLVIIGHMSISRKPTYPSRMLANFSTVYFSRIGVARYSKLCKMSIGKIFLLLVG